MTWPQSAIHRIRIAYKRAAKRLKVIRSNQRKRRKALHNLRFHLRPFYMFDSVDVSQIPRAARAVAGYVGGNWPTYQALTVAFPKAHKLSIAISATEDAACLDIETGDATPAEAPGWVRRQRDNGLERPTCYGSVSVVKNEIVPELSAKGFSRKQYKIWTAHYTGKPHICGPHTCGELPYDADATQWTSSYEGKNLDCSLISSNFFT